MCGIHHGIDFPQARWLFFWGAEDIQDYRSCLSRARNPAGFLIVKLSDMEKAINAEQGTEAWAGPKKIGRMSPKQNGGFKWLN